ncbi:hypothetical protein SCA6_002871 [Theobroma cacao]
MKAAANGLPLEKTIFHPFNFPTPYRMIRPQDLKLLQGHTFTTREDGCMERLYQCRNLDASTILKRERHRREENLQIMAYLNQHDCLDFVLRDGGDLPKGWL